MSRKALAACAAVVGLALPSPVAAHAIGGTFQLPVPLWLYLIAAGLAVTASFALILSRGTVAETAYPVGGIPASLAAASHAALRGLGLAWWYGGIAVGTLVADISPLPAVLLWVGIWVGLPIVAAVAGNPWPSLSPFRSTFGGLDWLARRAGLGPLDLGLRYPAGLGRWPAVALLGIAIWAELILPGGEVATNVAALMVAYTLLTLIGMTLFGSAAWLRNGELFEVLLGWFGRIGPIARRSVSAELCEECGEGCDARRCLDCPECAVTADDGDRRPVIRPWIVGLTDVRRAGWSDAAFIVLVLAGVTYDGLRETAAGAALLSAILPPVQAALGASGATFLLVDTLTLLIVFGAFFAAFSTAAWLTRALRHSAPRRQSHLVAGAYAATLLPIAAGYLVAHYLTLVLQAVVWLPSLLADPLMSLAPQLDWIPVSFVWYLSVLAIVGGHVAAVALAHRLTPEATRASAVRAGLPMLALMVGYTVLSLWIIAQPIVVEPARPAALGIGA